ncbi:MAG TPA: calcium-binding protein, partial [Xanthobacteraceae bacterium]|nr:calcium-binding protein [Xanthobacteraceae bacterium]
LNKRELGGRVTPQEFAVVDADKSGTLSKNEYLMVVEKRFKAADPDNDGTLDEKELVSRAGRALLRLLQP